MNKKKLITFLLALTMILSLSVGASAAETTEAKVPVTLAVQRVREVVDALPEEDAALLRALYLQTPPLTPVCLQRENRNPGDDAALQKRKAASAFEAANLSQVL